MQADEAARKLESAGKVLEDLGAKVAEQEKAVLQLNGLVSQLVEAKNWEAQALVSAFGGSAGDAKENQLEGEVAALVPQVEQVRGGGGGGARTRATGGGSGWAGAVAALAVPYFNLRS